jgi:hypothetical protein
MSKSKADGAEKGPAASVLPTTEYQRQKARDAAQRTLAANRAAEEAKAQAEAEAKMAKIRKDNAKRVASAPAVLELLKQAQAETATWHGNKDENGKYIVPAHSRAGIVDDSIKAAIKSCEMIVNDLNLG